MDSSPAKQHGKTLKSPPGKRTFDVSGSFFGSQTYAEISELDISENDSLDAELIKVNERKRKYNIRHSKIPSSLESGLKGLDGTSFKKDDSNDLEISSLEESADLSLIRKRRKLTAVPSRKEKVNVSLNVIDHETSSNSKNDHLTLTDPSYDISVDDELDETVEMVEQLQHKKSKISKLAERKQSEMIDVTDASYNVISGDVSSDDTLNDIKMKLVNKRKKSTYAGKKSRVNLTNIYNSTVNSEKSAVDESFHDTINANKKKILPSGETVEMDQLALSPDIKNTAESPASSSELDSDIEGSKPVKSPKRSDSEKSPKRSDSEKSPKRSDSEKSPKRSDSEKSPKRSDSEKSPRRSDSEKSPRRSDPEKSPKRSDPEKSPKRSDSEKSPKISDSEKSPKIVIRSSSFANASKSGSNNDSRQLSNVLTEEISPTSIPSKEKQSVSKSLSAKTSPKLLKITEPPIENIFHQNTDTSKPKPRADLSLSNNSSPNIKKKLKSIPHTKLDLNMEELLSQGTQPAQSQNSQFDKSQTSDDETSALDSSVSFALPPVSPYLNEPSIIDDSQPARSLRSSRLSASPVSVIRSSHSPKVNTVDKKSIAESPKKTPKKIANSPLHRGSPRLTKEIADTAFQSPTSKSKRSRSRSSISSHADNKDLQNISSVSELSQKEIKTYSSPLTTRTAQMAQSKSPLLESNVSVAKVSKQLSFPDQVEAAESPPHSNSKNLASKSLLGKINKSLDVSIEVRRSPRKSGVASNDFKSPVKLSLSPSSSSNEGLSPGPASGRDNIEILHSSSDSEIVISSQTLPKQQSRVSKSSRNETFHTFSPSSKASETVPSPKSPRTTRNQTFSPSSKTFESVPSPKSTRNQTFSPSSKTFESVPSPKSTRNQTFSPSSKASETVPSPKSPRTTRNQTFSPSSKDSETVQSPKSPRTTRNQTFSPSSKASESVPSTKSTRTTRNQTFSPSSKASESVPSLKSTRNQTFSPSSKASETVPPPKSPRTTRNQTFSPSSKTSESVQSPKSTRNQTFSPSSKTDQRKESAPSAKSPSGHLRYMSNVSGLKSPVLDKSLEQRKSFTESELFPTSFLNPRGSELVSQENEKVIISRKISTPRDVGRSPLFSSRMRSSAAKTRDDSFDLGTAIETVSKQVAPSVLGKSLHNNHRKLLLFRNG